MTSTTDMQHLSTLNSASAVLSTSTRLLRAQGYADVADRIIRQATGTARTPVVVFIGESGRGKTALVNLLAPSLRGSGVEEAGHALYRMVFPARQDGDGTVWVYSDGSRSARRLAEGDPIGLEVTTDAGPLGDVILLDAPSMGGLAASQSQLNLKILEAASVAIFVTDAGALLSSAELAYLERCSAQVESVGVVITKTDLYPGSWRDVVAGNAALLSTRIPRLAGSYVIGVSPTIATAADSVTDPAQREWLRNASGLPQLVGALQRDLARAGTAPTANALRLARTALDAHRQARHAQLVIASDPADARAGMVAERQRLSELKDEQQRWTLDLERDLGELRADVMRKAGSNLDGWATQWRSRIQTTRTLRAEKTTQQLTSDIFAELLELRTNAINETEEQLGNLARRVFRGIPLPAVLDELLQTAESPADPPQLASEKHRTGFDPTLMMSIMMGSGMGNSIASLLAGSAATIGLPLALAGTGAGIPFMVAGAGGWFAVNRLYRHNMVERNRFLAEVPRLVQAERAVIVDYLDARIRRLKPEIVVTYRNQLQESLTGLQQLIRESQAQEQLSAQAAQERKELLSRDVASLDKQLADIDASLAKLRLL